MNEENKWRPWKDLKSNRNAKYKKYGKGDTYRNECCLLIRMDLGLILLACKSIRQSLTS